MQEIILNQSFFIHNSIQLYKVIRGATITHSLLPDNKTKS